MAEINKHNVGRIAERIVANELEYRGFRVSDLNKEGLAANADLLAVKDGKPYQIQVKGSTYDGTWWVNYIYCDADVISGSKSVFNRHQAFYFADIVVLFCVKSTKEYRCVVMSHDKAEQAAQICIDYQFRCTNRDGSQKKPGKVWGYIDYVPKTKSIEKLKGIEREQALLKEFEDRWDVLGC